MLRGWDYHRAERSARHVDHLTTRNHLDRVIRALDVYDAAGVQIVQSFDEVSSGVSQTPGGSVCDRMRCVGMLGGLGGPA